jgi:hypothetical protein
VVDLPFSILASGFGYKLVPHTLVWFVILLGLIAALCMLIWWGNHRGGGDDDDA